MGNGMQIIIAKDENIDDIVSLRVEMQVEDWNRTLNKDFSVYAGPFSEITKDHIREHLINDITLTTNTPAAAHIYEKVGFKKISSKYFLEI